MKTAITIALVALFASNSTFAATHQCVQEASEKNLSGAAKDSFMKKCEAKMDMTDACNAQAKEQKLAGAAMMSFVNKCVKDAEKAAAKK